MEDWPSINKFPHPLHQSWNLQRSRFRSWTSWSPPPSRRTSLATQARAPAPAPRPNIPSPSLRIPRSRRGSSLILPPSRPNGLRNGRNPRKLIPYWEWSPPAARHRWHTVTPNSRSQHCTGEEGNTGLGTLNYESSFSIAAQAWGSCLRWAILCWMRVYWWSRWSWWKFFLCIKIFNKIMHCM